jgi:hypothetical protein
MKIPIWIFDAKERKYIPIPQGFESFNVMQGYFGVCLCKLCIIQSKDKAVLSEFIFKFSSKFEIYRHGEQIGWDYIE